MRYRRHGISSSLDWKTSLVLERFSNLWTESGIPISGDEDLYLQHWMSLRSSDLELRESYFVCMEEFLNLGATMALRGFSFG